MNAEFLKNYLEARQEISYKRWDKIAWTLTILIVLFSTVFVVGSIPLIIANEKAQPIFKW